MLLVKATIAIDGTGKLELLWPIDREVSAAGGQAKPVAQDAGCCGCKIVVVYYGKKGDVFNEAV